MQEQEENLLYFSLDIFFRFIAVGYTQQSFLPVELGNETQIPCWRMKRKGQKQRKYLERRTQQRQKTFVNVPLAFLTPFSLLSPPFFSNIPNHFTAYCTSTQSDSIVQAILATSQCLQANCPFTRFNYPHTVHLPIPIFNLPAVFIDDKIWCFSFS